MGVEQETTAVRGGGQSEFARKVSGGREGMGEAEGQPGWRHLQGQPSDGRRVRTARTKAADKKSWKVPLLLPGQLLSPSRFAICISSSRLNLQRKNQRLAESLSPSHCVSGSAQVFAESVGRRPSFRECTRVGRSAKGSPHEKALRKLPILVPLPIIALEK